MAKQQAKNLATLMREAKTFHDLVKLQVDFHRSDNSTLRKLEARRQRYDLYQGNKKIPTELRKQIAELETAILRDEPGHEVYGRKGIRLRKENLAKLYKKAEHVVNPPKPLTTTNKAFRVGKAYPGQSITRTYDGHIWEVLKGHFEELPRAKGQRTSFRIVAALPEKTEYLQLKERHFTQTLETLVDSAYGIVDELHGELQDAYENMPEGLQDSSVGQARSEAAEQLESISDDIPTVTDSVSAIQLVHYPLLRQNSRGDRADEASAILRAASEAIRQFRTKEAKLKKAEAKALDVCRPTA